MATMATIGHNWPQWATMATHGPRHLLTHYSPLPLPLPTLHLLSTLTITMDHGLHPLQPSSLVHCRIETNPLLTPTLAPPPYTLVGFIEKDSMSNKQTQVAGRTTPAKADDGKVPAKTPRSRSAVRVGVGSALVGNKSSR